MGYWGESIFLPEPRANGALERVLSTRSSVRQFSPTPLSMAEISQLLWAAQGVTHGDGFRTAPSAGALYPLHVTAVVGALTGLVPGIYRYSPQVHQLAQIRPGDFRDVIAAACVHQPWIAGAAVVFVICGAVDRTASKYGARAARYMLIEVGHVAQNLLLQAAAFGLGAAVVGAFDDTRLKNLLALSKDEEALYVVPVGWP